MKQITIILLSFFFINSMMAQENNIEATGQVEVLVMIFKRIIPDWLRDYRLLKEMRWVEKLVSNMTIIIFYQ